jgi:hypothetical protein
MLTTEPQDFKREFLLSGNPTGQYSGPEAYHYLKVKSRPCASVALPALSHQPHSCRLVPDGRLFASFSAGLP